MRRIVPEEPRFPPFHCEDKGLGFADAEKEHVAIK